MVVTTDAITDQVDFRLAEIDSRAGRAQGVGRQPERPGGDGGRARRGGRVARVAACTAHSSWPGTLSRACCRWRSDLTWPSPAATRMFGTGRWSISVTAIGRTTARGPLTRSGARPGDVLLVTGAFGGSILGRHLAVEPRVARSAAAARGLRTARGHRRQRRAGARRLATGRGERLRRGARPGGDSDRARGACRLPNRPAARRWSTPSATAKISSCCWRRRPRRRSDSPRPPARYSRHANGRFVEQVGLWQITDAGNRTPLEPAGFLH